VKYMAAAMTLIVSGCASGTLPWAQGPQLSESACTASCNAHYDQCPQVFAAFPERGAVECPAERKVCLKGCASNREVANAGATSTVSRASGAPTEPATLVPAATAAAPTPATDARPPTAGVSAPATDARAVPATTSPVRAVSSKEVKLRELKHLYEEGLVTDDVYKERQRAILSEP